MRRQRNTKILATLGPASDTSEIIGELFRAGADVFRLNFSHGSHADHKARFDIIRALEAEIGYPIGILADLQGPKIRLGEFADGGVELETGGKFRLDLEQTPGTIRRAPLPHVEVFEAIEKDDALLIDDGRVRLRVEKTGADFAETEILVGGAVSDRKGVNLPDTMLPLSALTKKDHRDLNFALDLGVDWIALSFVQRPEDVADAKRLIAGRAAVMSKIEKPTAMHQIEAIVELSDAIMVARGDLGVELPVEDVPGLQKQLVRLARNAGKPVVVATQMLESMVALPVPTRAEVSDVATAVYDGADAVMLSAETAAGANPVEAVATMNRVAEKVETDPLYGSIMDAVHFEPEATAADAITAAARQVAETISAKAIVTYTTSGSTALRASRERPGAPILVLTPNQTTARRLALAWGLHCVQTDDAIDFTDMVDKACHFARVEAFAEPGERLVITAGVPFGTPGSTNTLRISWVPAE